MDNCINFENKYIVVKREDAEKYLNEIEQVALDAILTKINANRHYEGKKKNEYLVVNSNEDYAYKIALIMKEHGHYTQSGNIKISK